VALAAVAALTGGAMAVGCGTQRGPVFPAATSRSASPTPSRTAPAPVLPPRQRAQADARAILGAFVPPPGARRLASDPAAAILLRQPPTYPGVNNLVDDVSFWRVAMAPTDVLDWEAAHLPRQFESGSGGEGPWGSGGYINGPTEFDGSWSLPTVYWVLPDRALMVAVEAIGNGQSVVRVDAQVTWLDHQPASERLPSAATIVTFTAVRGSASYLPPAPAPATITDPARVRRIAALVNSLPLYPQGMINPGCPMDAGQRLVLTFRARSGGPALAVAALELGGCPVVTLTIDGRQQPPLTGASTLARETLQAAGLHWPGYDQADSSGPGETPGPIVSTTPAGPAT
jgi:hypothetical protein